MGDYYIYSHCDVDTGKCFYIGHGKGDRKLDGRSRSKAWYERAGDGYRILTLISGIESKIKAMEIEEYILKTLTSINDCGGLVNLAGVKSRSLQREYYGLRSGYNEIRIEVDGVVYPSIRDASRETGISRYLIKNKYGKRVK